MEKEIAVANNNIEKVANFIRKELPDLPNTFNGLLIDVNGVAVMSYACSGLSVCGINHLPSDRLNFKVLHDAEAYRRDVYKVAEQISLKNGLSKYGRVYRHDGKKFVRI